jgi:hypothetical protein
MSDKHAKPKSLLSIREVAEQFGVSRATASSQGRLVRVGPL